METIFLWFVLCLDGSACTDVQVYQIDSFKGKAAMTDCKAREKEEYAKRAHGKVAFLMGCKSERQFNRKGTAK